MKNAMLELFALILTSQIAQADTIVSIREGSYTLSSGPLNIDAAQIIENPDASITIISPNVVLGNNFSFFASDESTASGICKIFGKELYSQSSVNSSNRKAYNKNLMLLSNGAVRDYTGNYYDLFSVTCK